jgi:hypothetical protein
MQENRPVAYYSRKLNSVQCNYATIDKELLCVLATLKEFQTMLLGAELHIYTDHKNILNVGNLSEQWLCWISYVDEYGPKIHYIEGPRNVIADTFSRLSCKDMPSTLVGKKAVHIVGNSELESLYSSLIDNDKILQCFLNLPCCLLNNEKEKRPKKCRKYSADTHLLACNGNNYFCDSNAEHCYLNFPEDMVEDSLLDLENVKEKQDEDNYLRQSLTKHPTWYSCKNIKDVNSILCNTKPGDNAANWKIVLPKDLIVPTIRWYHQVTGHPGRKRLNQHIHQCYYNCDLCRLVVNFKCNYCQRNKLDGKGYGFLSECKVRLIPFEECATDLIGPWTIQVHGNPYKFEALLVIDTVANLVELIRIDDKRSKTVARKFAQCWLTCCPWPQHCVHDPGTEFTGPEFQTLLQICHIRDVCTTAKKSTVQYCVQKNAPNSGKCSENIITW